MARSPAAESETAATKPRGRHARRIVPFGILIVLLAGGSYGIWRFVEPHVVAARHYRFDPRDIDVTPSPPWIHSDVKAEVLRQAGLQESLSVLESGLAPRVAAAFSLHPWVAKVIRVTKRAPAGLEVEIAYRQPVCMVEVPGGLFPVDETGVLLPTGDFTADEAAGYPRLSNIQTVTEGPVGTVWLDTRVRGAAKIAAALFEDWEPLKLYRITALGSGETSAAIEYELYTRQQTRVLWGHADADASSGEPSAEEKLSRLKKYATAREGLDRSEPHDIDVRRPGNLVVGPRTAVLDPAAAEAQGKQL